MLEYNEVRNHHCEVLLDALDSTLVDLQKC